MKVRFAPSPTGYLHIGNARTALINWLFAKAHGGRFLLRMDDTDAERSTPAFAQGIRDDLAWLGLAWDEEASQVARLDRYAEVGERLRADGRIYPCYETPEELEYKRRRQRARGLPPVYDREGATLSPARRASLEAEGRRPHWRFRLDHVETAWDDLVRGRQAYHGAHLSDPVVRRADGTWLYMLPSVIDDADLGVTHVLRGEDHVTNTAVQIQMFAAIGAAAPVFGHVPLITGPGGQGMSKREGSQALRDFRAEGIEAAPMLAMLASLGTAEAADPHADLAALVARFDIRHFGRSQPQFDPAELFALNARHLHGLDFPGARAGLAAAGLADADEPFWLAVRANLRRFAEARDWWAVIHAPLAPAIADAADAEVCAAAAAALPPEPWDETTWGAIAGAAKAATGKKGRALFHPLRLALTGRENGPELKVLLPMIGRARARARLLGETA